MTMNVNDNGGALLHASLEQLRTSLTTLLDEQQRLIAFCNEQNAKVQDIQKTALAVIENNIHPNHSVELSTPNVLPFTVRQRRANS